MHVAARLDGQRLKLAQFTRAARGAVVDVEPLPSDGEFLWRVAVRHAPGRITGLLAVLKACGARPDGDADDEAGTFDGTCAFPLSIVDGHLLAGVDSLRRATQSLRLRITGGLLLVDGEALDTQLESLRSLLTSLDPSWEGFADGPVARPHNA